MTPRMKNVSATFPDHGLSGFVQTLELLRDEKVQEFVAEVRAREGLEDVRDQEALGANLAKCRPDAFVEESMRPAADFWVRWVTEEAKDYEVPEEWDVFAETYEVKDPWKAARVFLWFFGRGLGPVAKGSARVISRYIVKGFLEIPMPCGLPTTVVGRVPLAKGEDMVMAWLTPFSDIDQVVRDLRRVYSQTFARGQRHKLPEKERETLWLRFCGMLAGKEEGEPDGGRYRWLAELLYELRPKLRPPGEPLDPIYEVRLERDADRIWANSKFWDQEVKPHLSGPCEQ